MIDIVTSTLRFWEGARVWVIATPMTGFSETFSQHIMEVSPGGGSTKPEPDARAQAALFVVEGDIQVTLDGVSHRMPAASLAFLPAGSRWTLLNLARTRRRPRPHPRGQVAAKRSDNFTKYRSGLHQDH